MERLRRSAKEWVRRNKNCLRFVMRTVVSFVMVPGVMAVAGVIAEACTYKTEMRPGFHVLHFFLAAIMASPFILLRWCWKWPKHLGKLELFVCVVQGAAFAVGLHSNTITGHDIYQSNSFIRKEFGSEEFLKISTENQTWGWLNSVVEYVYNRSDGSSVTSRKLSGRMAMVTSIRLRQYRVKPVNCSHVFRGLGIVGSDRCYPPFTAETEDRTTYGTNKRLQFRWYNTEVPSASGHRISMEDYKIQGDFGRYPVAGFWVWLSPNLTHRRVKQMLHFMKLSKWIDNQTRAIGLDVAIGLLDFVESPIWANVEFLLEVNRAGRFVPFEPRVNINWFLDSELKGKDLRKHYLKHVFDQGNPELLKKAVDENEHDDHVNCTVRTLRSVLQPTYFALLPFIVYHIIIIGVEMAHNWRYFTTKPFITLDILWIGCIATAICLLMQSLSYIDCGRSVFKQDIFKDTIPLAVEIRDSPAVSYTLRFEVLQLSAAWTRVRLLLSSAIFLQTFMFLKFLMHLKALGVLMRTMRFALMELLSFSFSFLVVFAAFVVTYYYVFSIEVKEYSTPMQSIGTLWLGLLGELTLTPELWRSGWSMLVLVMIFSFVSGFVLLTLIISIVSRAYEKARHPDAWQSRHTTIVDQNSGTDAPDPNEKEQLVSEVATISTTLKTWRRYAGEQRARMQSAVTPAELQDPSVSPSQPETSIGIERN